MDLIIAIVGSGALFSFITFLITRNDNRKNEIKGLTDSVNALSDRLAKTEKDTIRTQLLLLMFQHQDDVHEILRVGQYYFETLKGDWYLTSLYNRFLIDHDIAKPEWFNDEN